MHTNTHTLRTCRIVRGQRGSQWSSCTTHPIPISHLPLPLHGFKTNNCLILHDFERLLESGRRTLQERMQQYDASETMRSPPHSVAKTSQLRIHMSEGRPPGARVTRRNGRRIDLHLFRTSLLSMRHRAAWRWPMIPDPTSEEGYIHKMVRRIWPQHMPPCH